MAEGDLAEALRRLMERGWRTRRPDPRRHGRPARPDGRLERRREELLERYELGDVLGDIRRELDEIVGAGADRASSGGSTRPSADATPPDERPTRRCGRCSATSRRGGSTSSTRCRADVGDRIRGLQEYDFLEPDARERFDELVERLRQQVLDQYVAGMSDAIRSMTPEDLAANREMVRDLNELIRAADRRRRPGRRASSWPSTAQFFPGARTFDDIIDQLAAADGRDAVAACAR